MSLTDPASGSFWTSRLSTAAAYRQARLRSEAQAHVLRPNGLVLVAAISRFASALDGLVSHFFTDPRYAWWLRSPSTR